MPAIKRNGISRIGVLIDQKVLKMRWQCICPLRSWDF